ncbi:hypothetical protein AYR66_21005 [Noviherbaspirillum denitrificans]|uniref:Integrase catalytic domain-containing protein n=1 Tax=Noviherbaspirillum denitrificans TaxID=1968433 RepID=A0A254TG06_9BURK|nr:hypothetical protein AYR66_21005 [Noviherbaspirillum denitrificans]
MDQSSQFSRYDWQDFLNAHNLKASMSRPGNCHDNAVDYIEMFYDPKRRHGYNNRLSPVDYEKQCFKRLASV